MVVDRKSNFPFVLICIPSFNQPNQLINLLACVGTGPSKLENKISEDCGSKRDEVRDLSFGVTRHFYIFKWALFFLGEKNCDKIIWKIKKLVRLRLICKV